MGAAPTHHNERTQINEDPLAGRRSTPRRLLLGLAKNRKNVIFMATRKGYPLFHVSREREQTDLTYAVLAVRTR